MKRFFVVLTVFALATGAAFAAGQIEGESEEAPGWGRGPRGYELPEETTALTGVLELTLSRHPELVVDGEKWELLYPMHLAEGIDVEHGATVSVEGYEVPGPRFADEDYGERYLLVTKATIGGAEYDLSQFVDRGMGPMAFGGPSGRGRRDPRGGRPGFGANSPRGRR